MTQVNKALPLKAKVGTKCLVSGCPNVAGQGTFIGQLCAPCHEMLRTGKVHPKTHSFIADLLRKTLGIKQ